MGYTPVFSSIYDGTLYGKWPDAAVFATLLPLADAQGRIDMSLQAIAGRTGWPIDLLRQGIEGLCSPDPASRTATEEGRRMVLLDPARPWGWRLVNHGRYREKARKAAHDAARVASGENAARMSARRPDSTRDDPTRPDATRSQTQTQTKTDSVDTLSATVPRAREDQPQAEAAREEVRACVLLRGAGFTAGNPMHPDLIAAVAAGMTAEDLVAVAQEFPSKPFVYWIRTAVGRRREAAATPELPKQDEAAAKAWERLIATEGAERPEPAAKALAAVGGWMAVRQRTAFDEPKLRAAFCRAYREAAA